MLYAKDRRETVQEIYRYNNKTIYIQKNCTETFYILNI